MPAKQGEHCESTARDTLIDGQRSAFEKGTRFCLHGSVTRAYIPQVLNIDVSKLVPTRFFDYVAPLFPGLFFEISVLLANPNLIRQFLANTAQVLGGSHYLPVAIGLFINAPSTTVRCVRSSVPSSRITSSLQRAIHTLVRLPRTNKLPSW